MMRHLLCLLFVLCGSTTYGQSYFNERYNNPTPGAQTVFNCVVPTDSGYLAIGLAFNYPVLGTDALALRFISPSGQPIRSRYYPPLNTGVANCLHRLADGGYVFVGQSVLSNPLRTYTSLWRFNSLGDTLWTRRYLRERGESANALCVLPDGGFAIVGELSTGIRPSSTIDVLLTRTDSAGNILWWQHYSHEHQNIGYTIAPTADGGFLLGGFSYDLTQTDSYVVKTDSLGTEQWSRTFGSPALDDGSVAVCALRDGTYLLASSVGTRVVAGVKYYHHILYHLDSAGTLLSARRYGPEGDSQQLYAIHQLPDGSVVMAGQQTVGQGLPEGVIFKVCPAGDSVWYRTYRKLTGGTSHNYLRDVRPTADGGLVGAGLLFCNLPDTGSSDAWMFKLDSAGYLQAGGAPVPTSCRPLGLPAASPAVGVAVWPNPSSDGHFQLAWPGGASAELTLTDALGRLLLRRPLPTGPAEVPLSLSAQPPGLYLLRLTHPTAPPHSWRLVRE